MDLKRISNHVRNMQNKYKNRISRIDLKYKKYLLEHNKVIARAYIILFLMRNLLNILLLMIHSLALFQNKDAGPKDILFIEPLQQGYGDLFIQTPLFEALNKNDCKVHILCKKSHSDIIRNNPYINKLLFWKKSDIAFILKNRYKLIIGLGRDTIRENLLMLSKPCTKKYILDSDLKLWKESFSELSTPKAWQKILDYYTKKENHYSLPKVYLSKKEKKEVSKLRQEYKKPRVGLIVGVGNKLKLYPFWAKIIEELNQRPGSINIFLLGSKNNLGFPSSGRLVNFTLAPTYRKAIITIAAADIIVGAEGSLIHIAAALGKNLVLLEGSDAFYKNSFLEIGSPKITILSHHRCKLWLNTRLMLEKRYCFLDKEGKIIRNNPCLANIKPKNIIDQIKKHIKLSSSNR